MGGRSVPDPAGRCCSGFLCILRGVSPRRGGPFQELALWAAPGWAPLPRPQSRVHGARGRTLGWFRVDRAAVNTRHFSRTQRGELRAQGRL